MSMADNLRSLMIPAMEADDITAKVKAQMSGKTTTSSGEPKTAADKTDSPKAVNSNSLTQVDNLTTGLRENDPDDGSTPEPDDEPTDDNPGESGIDDSEIGGDNPDDTGEDDASDPGTDDDSTSDTNTPDETQQETYMNKNILRDNMICLYNILSSDINRLTDYTSPIDDAQTIDIMNRVITNFRECKQALYDIITEKLTDYTYTQLMTKYVAIKKIYDISTEMIEKHVSNITGKDSPTKKHA